MKLEIVSHCWKYARLLRYQLSSVYLFPPKSIEVLVTVFCANSAMDASTWRVLDSLSRIPAQKNVRVKPRVLETKYLFRRAIGRNLAAKETDADWVWFADCDMVFRNQALDILVQQAQEVGGPLVFPQTVMIHKNHVLGDRAIERSGEASELIDIDPTEFHGRRYERAIGGIQIVPREVARRLGYCPQKRWQRPAPCWQRTREDPEFRRMLGTPGTPLPVPDVYRVRHSQCGREVVGIEL